MGDFFEVKFGPTEPDRNYMVEHTPEFSEWWESWGSPDMHRLYRKYGINVFRRSTALLGLDRLCREKRFRGRRCIELGTCKGLTAIILSRHFDEVVTFDVFKDDDKRALAESCGANNIVFHDVPDNATRGEIISGLDFDAAYVDGNHAQDTETDFKQVGHCGRLLFHEYWPLQPPVWGLVNSLRRSGTVETFTDSFALWTANRG
jgi:hypothetical protein